MVWRCNHSPSSNLSSSEQLETCPTISTYSAPSSCESLCLLCLLGSHTESSRSTQNYSIQQTLHGHTEQEEGEQKKFHSIFMTHIFLALSSQMLRSTSLLEVTSSDTFCNENLSRQNHHISLYPWGQDFFLERKSAEALQANSASWDVAHIIVIE